MIDRCFLSESVQRLQGRGRKCLSLEIVQILHLAVSVKLRRLIVTLNNQFTSPKTEGLDRIGGNNVRFSLRSFTETVECLGDFEIKNVFNFISVILRLVWILHREHQKGWRPGARTGSASPGNMLTSLYRLRRNITV